MTMYNEGDVYSYMLFNGEEVIGEFVTTEKYGNGLGYVIRVKNYCFVFLTPSPDPRLPPIKAMYSGTEGGNFTNEIIIYEPHILYVKPVVKDSEIWGLYCQNLDVIEKQEGKYKEYKS